MWMFCRIFNHGQSEQRHDMVLKRLNRNIKKNVCNIHNLKISLCVISGGMFFTTPMRSKNYVTLMDPFQEKYGNIVAAVLFIPVIMSDIFWAACVLSALGESYIKSELRLKMEM